MHPHKLIPSPLAGEGQGEGELGEPSQPGCRGDNNLWIIAISAVRLFYLWGAYIKTEMNTGVNNNIELYIRRALS